MAAAAARHGSSSEVSFVAYKEPFKLGSSYELVKQLGRGAYGVVACVRRVELRKLAPLAPPPPCAFARVLCRSATVGHCAANLVLCACVCASRFAASQREPGLYAEQRFSPPKLHGSRPTLAGACPLAVPDSVALHVPACSGGVCRSG